MTIFKITDKDSSCKAYDRDQQIHPSFEYCKKQKNRSHNEENGRADLFHGAVLDVDDLFHDSMS